MDDHTEDEVAIMCLCGRPAVTWISKNANNPKLMKNFYTCSRKGEQACTFVAWDKNVTVSEDEVDKKLVLLQGRIQELESACAEWGVALRKVKEREDALKAMVKNMKETQAEFHLIYNENTELNQSLLKARQENMRLQAQAASRGN